MFDCLVGYVDEVIMPLALILAKKNAYVKRFKDKSGNKKLMTSRIDDSKLLEKQETIRTSIENLKILSWLLHQFMIIDI